MSLHDRAIGRDLFPSYSAEQRATIKREFARRRSKSLALEVSGTAMLFSAFAGAQFYRPLLLGINPGLALIVGLLTAGACAACSFSLRRCPGCEQQLRSLTRALSCTRCGAELR